MDIFTKKKRREVMQAVKASGSIIEKTLAKALWAKGCRYRKNCKNIIGKPDIVFRKYKLAIFCDSEFWHGKDWLVRKKDFHSNKKFWYNKIETNIKRDKSVTRRLKKEGWVVIRFWGKDILKNTNKCVNKIIKFIGANTNEYSGN
ncbi:MAG: very short patch repair endonuclease [Endomicrobium sp.]|jgi:DNA mismatch endonuclease Vsr|nr:very short patch repair endonuclease [Endomicrobium sp.]